MWLGNFHIYKLLLEDQFSFLFAIGKNSQLLFTGTACCGGADANGVVCLEEEEEEEEEVSRFLICFIII